MNTKEKIIHEALNLFAKRGYGDVYVGDIAKAVGIKAPSLYKHFKNKQEIFEAIVEKLKDSYLNQTSQLNINGMNFNEDANIYSNISEESLIQIGKGLFLYFVHDEYERLFRRMLTIEQFNNTELAALYTKQYFDDPILYQSSIFELLIASGKFKEADSKTLALEFYTPIYTLMTLCDRHPEREPEALKILEEHIKKFNINNIKEINL